MFISWSRLKSDKILNRTGRCGNSDIYRSDLILILPEFNLEHDAYIAVINTFDIIFRLRKYI